jgi:hypothetical protein
MSRRRNVLDPLETTFAPRWYVVRSMYGTVIESRELVSGTDLKREFIAAMLQWMDAGWKLGEFSSASATFFCDRQSSDWHPGDRSAERRMVSIDPTDPHDVPMYGGAHLGSCPHCSD